VPDALTGGVAPAFDESDLGGLQFGVAYTLSKSMDDGSAQRDIIPNTYDAHNLWGQSDFDVRHIMIINYIYELPFLKSQHNVAGKVLGGWQVSGLVSAQTGRPITILSGVNNSGTGIGQDRADIVGPAYGSGACAGNTKACKDWLTLTSFVNNPAGTFGSVGKGSLRFPGAFSWDMGFTKNFKFTERFSLQFRAEFFNIFNRVNFDETTATGNFAKLSSKGNFGALQQASDPRIGQLALKLFF